MLDKVLIAEIEYIVLAKISINDKIYLALKKDVKEDENIYATLNELGIYEIVCIPEITEKIESLLNGKNPEDEII